MGIANTKIPTTAKVAEDAAAHCLAMRVRRVSRIITRIYDDALRPQGLTASQFTLLTTLAQQDGVTASEIGMDLDIEKSTLSRNLKRLEALGMVRMDPPAGRRGRGLHLTKKGEDAICQAYPVWRQAQMRVAAVWGRDSESVFDKLLGSADKLSTI